MRQARSLPSRPVRLSMTGLVLVEICVVGMCLHPYVLYPITLLFMKRYHPSARLAEAPTRRPPVAVYMSVYNEERVIVEKARSLLEMAGDYGPATIHIYVDGATDRTAELLRPFCDRIDLVVSTCRRGKTAGLNALLDRVDTPLVAFTDGNVRTSPSDLGRLVDAFADPNVGCASARLSYSNAPDTETSTVGAAYWSLEEAVKSLETATFGVIGVDGAFFVVDRACYSPAPDNLIDDLWVSLSVLIAGRRVVSVAEVVVTERSAVDWQEEFRRKARIACQAVNVHRRLWPQIRRLPPTQLYGYVSHRLMKWLTPFFLLFAAIDLIVVGGFAFGWLNMLAVLVIWALLLCLAAFAGLNAARLVLAAAASLLGVGTGVIQSVLFRKTYQYWTPAASVRP